MKFLEAEWRHLVMLNYEIDPAVLKPYVPSGTELDFHNGRTFISLVGFMFLKTRVMNFPIPFHRNFEEVNLRFYVRCRTDEGWNRGVVFIKEIVPRSAIAAIARWLYNERYVALTMRHQIETHENLLHVRYEWRFKGKWNSIYVSADAQPHSMPAGSEEEFIAEHYWGYTQQPDGSTNVYRVMHPKWQVHSVVNTEVNCDFEALYGKEFKPWLEHKPASAFLAEGSAISVSSGSKLQHSRRPEP